MKRFHKLALVLAAFAPSFAFASGSEETQSVVTLIFHAFDVALIIWLLIHFAKKPITEGLAKNADEVGAQIKAANEALSEATERLKSAESRLQSLDAELAETRAKREAETERACAELIANAKEESKRLMAEAKATAELELSQARAQIQLKIVDAAIAQAEVMISNQFENAANSKGYTDRAIALLKAAK